MTTDESIAASRAGREAATWNLSLARRAAGPTFSWTSQAMRIGGGSYDSANEAHNRYGDPHTAQKVVGYVEGLDWPVVSESTVGAYAMNNTFANTWTLTMPLYTGGQLEGRIKAGNYLLRQADWTLENTRQQVRYQTTAAYAGLIHQENLVGIAASAVDMASAQLKLINDQYTEGAVAKADVLIMEVRLANYRQNLVNAKNQAAVAAATLANAVGLPTATKISPTDSFRYETYSRTLEECEAYSLELRPDGMAAEYAVKAAKAQTEAAKAGYRPRVTGSVAKSISGNQPFRHERSDAWEAGIGISWSIFDNGLTEANVKQAEATTEQYRATAANIKKNILLETRNAYLNMRAAEENLLAAEVAVKQAEESHLIAQVRYEEGVDILLNVTDAQERLTQARSNYFTALYQYNLYRAALDRAMGVPVA